MKQFQEVESGGVVLYNHTGRYQDAGLFTLDGVAFAKVRGGEFVKLYEGHNRTSQDKLFWQSLSAPGLVAVAGKFGEMRLEESL